MFDDDTVIFIVVINEEEQYSIWPDLSPFRMVGAVPASRVPKRSVLRISGRCGPICVRQAFAAILKKRSA